MGRRIIEIVALLLGLVITAGVVIAIPMKSYNEYKDYLAEVEKQNEDKKQQAIKPELESITAELKEGIKYFANDMAEVRPEHFIVTANYTKEGQEPWSELVEEGDFTVSSPADFYAKGGKITVKYKGHATTVEVSLEPVVLESIEITVNPYTIKYQAGTSFDASGMIVTAHYNDGSAKVLADDQYTAPEKLLSIGDTAVTVSFTDGEVTKSADVAIGVSETLDNGAVASIVIVDGAIVNAGQQITTATMEVNAVYENGNRRPLAQDEYTIEAAGGNVEFGKMYHLTVSYNADPTKTVATDVKVRQTLQGENGTIVGGSKKTEDEYAVINGVITKLENQVSFAGNFASSVLKGDDAYLMLTLHSAAATVGDITVRCSNSYNVYFNGSNADDGYMMKPLQINTILDLTVNGREVKVPATVILRGCGPYESYAPLYGIYYEFNIEDVELDAGANKVMFNFKRSTVGATNCWGESPSTLNIDYVHFDTFGSEIPDDYTITGIEIQNNFAPTYGQKYSDLEVPVIGILDNGSKIGLSRDLYDVEISGGKPGESTFKFGTYTITATLKENPAIKASIDVEVPEFESFTVLTASVEIVDGRVHYVFRGTCTGYDAEDIELFDGGTIYPAVIELGETTFEMYVDVTETGYGITYWPHIRLNGVNYDNGANANGDVRGNGLEFTDGESVVLGDRSYTIVNQWSMPTLVVDKYVEAPVIPENPDDVKYDAELDNTFVSNKVLIGEFIYSSPETETSGSDQSSEYPGGIGGMDKVNKFVTYTFTLDKAAKVDFIWSVSGSKWNGSGNDGLTNAGENLAVVIDGKTVDVEGIALPAGTGSTEWWNMQQIVVKDVSLEAGTHTFTCLILTDGAGLNIGDMKVYSSAATVHFHTAEFIPAVEPDCTNTGLTKGIKCSECGEILTAQTVVPAKGHAYDHDLDADCNVCGFVRDVSCTHSFTGPVLEGIDGFYQKCDNEHCAETKPVSAPVADSYKAEIDNSFTSAKENVLKLIYAKDGAWGIKTNGKYKEEAGAPAGAIGNMDAAGGYVYYEFTIDKPGRIDIIWSIAGSNWDGSGNAGIADMANHMTITIDGKPVDIGGLALPAGEGDLAWWNLQQLVIEGVSLEAGLHTIRCDITAAGGLNVGPMVIEADKKVAPRAAEITGADLFIENDRVYYTLTYNVNGYDPATFEFFDGSTIYAYESFTVNGNTVVFKFDITDYTKEVWPHLRIDGNPWNGTNGDVKVDTATKSVELNGRTYTLKEQWDMPSVIYA